jgi:hypothetical protein
MYPQWPGGRGRGWGRGKSRERGIGRSPAMATSAPPLGDILATIRLDDLKEPVDSADGLSMITNCQYLTSYNWLYRAESRILVPGRKISITTS